MTLTFDVDLLALLGGSGACRQERESRAPALGTVNPDCSTWPRAWERKALTEILSLTLSMFSLIFKPTHPQIRN